MAKIEISGEVVYVGAPVKFALKQYPLGTMGKTRVHLELDDISPDRIQPVFINTLGTDPVTLANMPLAGGNNFSLEPTLYQTLQQCPLYVGIPIIIKKSTVELLTTVISSISYVQSTGEVTFKTVDSLPVIVAPANYNGLTLVCVVPTGLKFSVVQANIGLSVSPMGPKMDVLEYTTFTTEQSTVNANSWQKVYEVEPNCQNLFVLSKESTSLYSKQDGLRSFRIRIDGEDVVDRDVEINYGNLGGTGFIANRLRSPLYYDLIYKTLMNADIKLMSLGENPQDASQITVTSQFDTSKTLLICSPTPVTQQYKQVQLNLDGTTPISTLILYKQVVNQIKV
jgi:hypothetical protein